MDGALALLLLSEVTQANWSTTRPDKALMDFALADLLIHLFMIILISLVDIFTTGYTRNE